MIYDRFPKRKQKKSAHLRTVKAEGLPTSLILLIPHRRRLLDRRPQDRSTLPVTYLDQRNTLKINLKAIDMLIKHD